MGRTRLLWCWSLRPASLSDLLPPDEIEVVPFSGGQDDLPMALRDADGVLIRRGLRLDRETLAGASRLRFVQRAGASTENIDLGACGDRGIVVAATPMHIDMSVAEHALALMLAVARRIPRADAATRSGAYRELGLVPRQTSETEIATNWMDFEDLPTLFGRRLALIGLGEIGSAVAVRARAFGMAVSYYRRSRLTDARERELGVEFATLEAAVAEADFVSLHVPHDAATERMVDHSFLARMKRGAILINVSRGGLVEERSLANALATGQLAGAGIDVFVDEPLPADNPLLAAPNTVLTPHIASGTDLDRDVGRLTANLVAFVSGSSPVDIIEM